ncbi:unnamed protein product [Discula destructiva]
MVGFVSKQELEDLQTRQPSSFAPPSFTTPSFTPPSYTPSPVSLNKFWQALIPATFAAISFILVIVSLSAGHSPGVMEDYHVLYLNTSTFGKNLLDDNKLRFRSAPVMPVVTEVPNLLHRYHAREKRIDIGSVADSAVGGVGDAAGSVAGGAGEAASSVAGGVVYAASSAAGGVATAATAVASAAEDAADSAKDALEHLVDEAKTALEEIADDLADELYKKLGIQQFYSIHLTDTCYGNFTPNATATDAGFAVDNCTEPFQWAQALNITGMLNQSLNVGPFQLDLADIGMAQDVAESIAEVMKVLNSSLQATIAMYILAALFIGLSMAFSVWAVFALKWTDQRDQKTVNGRTKDIALYSNLAFPCIATLFLLIGNLVTTIGGKYAVEQIREHGGDLGLYAYRGSKFLAVTWSAFALLLVAAALWTFECAHTFLERRRRRSQPVIVGPKHDWDDRSSLRSSGSRMMEHF